MTYAQKSLLLLLLTLGLSACGVKSNSNKKMAFSESEVSFLMIEKKCTSGKADMEEVSKDITAFFYEYQRSNPKAFTYIPSRVYDYKNPLIINLQEMKAKFLDLKSKMSDADHMSTRGIEVENDLFYLYQNAMRFEGSKCSLSTLIQKKQNDIRPYLNLNDFCLEKSGDKSCSLDVFKRITSTDALLIEENTVSMCRSFDASNVNCRAQYSVQKRDKTKLHSLVSYYQKRFEKERFSSLFNLRGEHLKFACQKNESDTIMTIKVSSINHDIMALQELVDYVEATWGRAHFKLKIELVETKGSDVIEIIPSQSFISYVPDNNNRQIYLSLMLDPITKKKVLAHEFGHVLGFPDCYTEFFDNQKKDLVYYEMGSKNTNIMCSMKDGVRVPDDYFDQLLQNSCVFN